MTVRDLIKSSLRLIGVIGTGESGSADELNDGLLVLNDMISSWNTEGLMVYSKNKRSTILPTSGGTLALYGYLSVEAVKVIDPSSPGVEFPVEIVSYQEWTQISNRGLESTLPSKVYISKGTELLTGLSQTNFQFWPKNTEDKNLSIYVTEQIEKFSSLDSDILLPDGYSRALRYNLSVELAPEFGKPLDSVVASIANESKAQIARRNFEPTFLSSDAVGLTSRKPFNIISGS